MENKKSSIFIKKSEIKEPTITCVDKNFILESIPDCRLSEENLELKDKAIEWRWRFLQINGKEHIEVSFKEPGQPRKYINKQGKWVEMNIDPVFDRCVSKQYFVYA